MDSCAKCGWEGEKGVGRFCPRCGAPLSDEPKPAPAPNQSVPPIHLEPRHRLLNPLFLLSVAMILTGTILASVHRQEIAAWTLVGLGVPCLLIATVHGQRS